MLVLNTPPWISTWWNVIECMCKKNNTGLNPNHECVCKRWHKITRPKNMIILFMPPLLVTKLCWTIYKKRGGINMQLTFEFIKPSGESWFPRTSSFSSWDLFLKFQNKKKWSRNNSKSASLLKNKLEVKKTIHKHLEIPLPLWGKYQIHASTGIRLFSVVTDKI